MSHKAYLVKVTTQAQEQIRPTWFYWDLVKNPITPLRPQR